MSIWLHWYIKEHSLQHYVILLTNLIADSSSSSSSRGSVCGSIMVPNDM
jgi:hypothetical protein